MEKFSLKVIIKEDYQKALKKLIYFLFPTQSLLMDSYQKQKGPGTSN